jgi:hypothetical protein
MFPFLSTGSISLFLDTEIKMRFIGGITVLLAVSSVCMATSIIYPAFDSPLIVDEIIVAHHTYGKQVIGLDRSTRAVRWSLTAKFPIQRILSLDPNRMIAVHKDAVSVIDIRQGSILKTLDIHGFVFGCSASGNLFSQTKAGMIVYQDLATGRQVWESQHAEPNSNVSPQLTDGFIFLTFSPRSITHHSDGESKRFTMKGTNRVVCLDAKDAKVLWSETVPLSQKGYGVNCQAASGQNGLLCTTDNAVRLLDKKSGAILRQWRIDKDIDGADFWGKDRIVVCLGGIGETRRTIQVRNVSDFALVAEFTAEAQECESITVVGNIIILNSLYRTIGVDLGSKTVVWQKGQRHYTIHDGLLFYGEGIENARILGVCDPTTGNDTILYSEKIKE